MPDFKSLAINELDCFVCGKSRYPITLKNGMVIGGGEVIPELNFTLPSMIIEKETFKDVIKEYTQMITETTTRAIELSCSSLVVEFELLPELTLTPEWGAELTSLLKSKLEEVQSQHNIKTALRVTPNDIREFMRPPLLRRGEYVDKMFKSFELCAAAGADFLSIESTGGKEIHDDAILNGDLDLSIFSLAILASRDMNYLWKNIVEIARNTNTIPAGDSACGFANTAMVLAEQHFIPRVWAALIRVMTIPRSLIAFEKGAIGPNKDCAYEGVFIKAITGFPISLEGAEAAVAHLSPIGNIAKAVPDLWSNESVNNVKLLGAMAPVVSVEQLIYTTRLLNTANKHGNAAAIQLRDWHSESDAFLDPQAYVLKPDIALEIAREIIKAPTPYLRTINGARKALELLREAAAKELLSLSKYEMKWLDKLTSRVYVLPDDETEFIQSVLPKIEMSKVNLAEYDLKK